MLIDLNFGPFGPQPGETTSVHWDSFRMVAATDAECPLCHAAVKAGVEHTCSNPEGHRA